MNAPIYIKEKEVEGRRYEARHCGHSSADSLALSLRNAQTIEQLLLGLQFSSLVRTPSPRFYSWVDWGARSSRNLVRHRPEEHFQKTGPPSSAVYIPCLKENPVGPDEVRTWASRSHGHSNTIIYIQHYTYIARLMPQDLVSYNLLVGSDGQHKTNIQQHTAPGQESYRSSQDKVLWFHNIAPPFMERSEKSTYVVCLYLTNTA